MEQNNNNTVTKNNIRDPLKHTSCRHCKNDLREGARVCHQCGRHQSRFVQHFRAEWLGIIISIGMMAIALVQLQDAQTERNAAEKALQQASSALQAVKEVQYKTLALEKEASKYVLHAKKLSNEALLNALQEKLTSLQAMYNGGPPYFNSIKDKRKLFEVQLEIQRLSSKTRKIKNDIGQLDLELKAENISKPKT